ncbi:tyrosine protein phosphatase [Dactylosporangium maewongense]|uniref:Tyrosine protein phosphatase n=1 Tax=Dactylosporangium maewongense TaxID=634393 RepID=A0ABN1ZLD6_9ACTN
MRPNLFTVDLPGPGRVSTMAKPRGGDWLADEMAALRGAGVGVLVCALTAEELVEVDLADEPRAAGDAGLEFVAVPIPDRGVPAPGAVLPELRRLAGLVRAGGHVVTHCRFGIGRSAMLVVGILALNGVPPALAWQRLEDARGVPVPDTPDQRTWPDALLAADGTR